MKKVFIADASLVKEQGSYTFKESIEMARQLENLHVDVIEIPKIENVAKDTLLIKTISSFVKNSVLSVDAGCSETSIDQTALALCNALHPRLRIVLPISDVSMEYGYRKKGPAMIEMIAKLVSYAATKCAEVEFCAVDAVRADQNTLIGAIKAAVDAGATVITLCDSEGIILPNEFVEFVETVVANAEIDSSVMVGVSYSDKNGLATACSIMALKARANIVKTSVNGDVALLSTMIDVLRNCSLNCDFSSSLNFTSSKRILSQIKWITDSRRNFTDAVSTDDNQTVLLDQKDDISDFSAVLHSMGYDLSEEDMNRVFAEFQRVAEKKSVSTKELDAIVASIALQVPETYSLEKYIIQSGNVLSSSAHITMKKDGTELQGIAVGDGPIDAAFKTIEQIIGRHYELDDFQIQSVTQGHEAMGNAIVKLRNNGKIYSGNGISTDIIGASIKAYVNALNKIVYEEE